MRAGLLTQLKQGRTHLLSVRSMHPPEASAVKAYLYWLLTIQYKHNLHSFIHHAQSEQWIIGSRKMAGSEVSRIQRPEGELLNILEDLSALAWRRYSPRIAQTWHGRVPVDVPGGLPWVAFRFAQEDDDKIKRLEAAISSYEGAERWRLSAHIRDSLPGTNWMVCLERCCLLKRQAADANLQVWQYLERVDPGYLGLIYEDFNGLTNHVKACLDLHNR